jgi:5'-nucleotidase
LDIIVDIDDTIADLLTVWLSRYNADYHDTLTRDDVTAWDMTKFVKPECGVKIYDYLKDEHIYDEVEPIPGALMGVTRLRGMGHHILFVTANIHREKWEWLKRHGFLPKTWTSQDYICCYDKHLIKADAIIDDKPETIDRFPGLAILFDRPHNQVYNALWRAHSWGEVIELISKYQPCDDEAAEPPPLHPTELRCPEQVKAFNAILDGIKETHLRKNVDYSPANIQGTGAIGLCTRIWDKTARLLNLSGFRIEIASSRFEAPCQPKNESIEDTLLDLATYAIIALVYRQGKWGK